MRSKSAGGLMVKALGRKSRDLGSSPSRRSPFPASKIALEKINYLITFFSYFVFHTLTSRWSDLPTSSTYSVSCCVAVFVSRANAGSNVTLKS